MHQQISTVHHTLVSRKLAKSVHKIRRQLNRITRMRMLLIREILPAHASDHGCCVNPLTRKYLPNLPALVSRLIEQGKWLEAFSSQLSVTKQRAHADIGFTFIAYHQQRGATRGDDEQSLLKPRVETGEVSNIGKMLPVAVNHQMGKLALVHHGAEPVYSLLQLCAQ